MLCFNGLAARLGLWSAASAVALALPEAIAGFGVIATPFGGVFRTDFLIAALGLFLADHLCSLLAGLLR